MATNNIILSKLATWFCNNSYRKTTKFYPVWNAKCWTKRLDLEQIQGAV